MRRLSALISRISCYSRSHAPRGNALHGRSASRPRFRRLFLESLEPRQVLSTFTVANINDSGPGSLRDAINAANTQTGADIIQFASGVAGTITLTSGELGITDSLNLQGPVSGGITVSGNNASLVFRVSANSTISGLKITGGTSNDGGGIHNTATLYVSNCEFVTNTGANYTAFDLSGNPYTSRRPGGIFNSGTLTVSHSKFAGNIGGCIFSTGTLDVNACNFVANTGTTFQDPNQNGLPAYTTPVGSGIYNRDGGQMTISGSVFDGNIGTGIFNYYLSSMGAQRTKVAVTDSTFSNNLSGSGSGIFSIGSEVSVSRSTFLNNATSELQYASGGGINCYQGGILTVTSSTFSGNRANYGGGISATFGVDVKVSNSTFSANQGNRQSGGIFHYANLLPLKLNNTILANNTSGFAGTHDLGSHSGLTGSHNLIKEGNHPGLANTITGDPNLGPLANYGGPTWTMPLLPNSPAIDAGNDYDTFDLDGDGNTTEPLPLSTDQRGFPRFVGTVDIGAFESSGPGLVVEDIAGADTIKIEPGSLTGTLKTTVGVVVTDNIAVDGIVHVKGLGGNDTITITASLAGHVVVDGGGGADTYDITFGNLAGTVVVADSGTSGSDRLTVNGTDTSEKLKKNAGFIKWMPSGETTYRQEVDFDGLEHVTLNAAAGNDTVIDPNSGNFEILGGPGDDTIIIAENFGLVTADGGEGSDTYIVQAMSSYLVSRQFVGFDGSVFYIIQAGIPQGPISISDTGATGTDATVVEGTSGADTITQTGNQIVANGATITLSGADTLTVDGGGGAGDSFTVVGTPTVPATVQGISDLVVVGTPGNDQIHFNPGSGGQVVAKLNGVVVASSSPTGRLIAYGLAGDDEIQVAAGVTLPAWLYGDAGNDQLNAGNGGSLLFGGDGNDDLKGGSGRDVLIGGQGADNLNGNGNDDLLVAGSTTMDDRISDPDAHNAFWLAVLADWNSTDSLGVRVGKLRASLLPEVVDDLLANAIDSLNGASGDDWLICAIGEDKVTGKAEATN